MPIRITAVFAIAVALVAPHAAWSKQKTNPNTQTYVPAITLTLEVQTPSGGPRVYPTATGPTYWTMDLPVAKGDQVKLNVFVATGGGELQQVKVRLDNQLLTTLTSVPWSTHLDTNTIGAGDHFVEVWAQELEPDGKRTAFADKTMTFTVASSLPSAAVGAPVVSAVKGEQQVLTPSSVTNVPLTGPGTPPALPAVIASGSADTGSTVTLTTDDPAADQAITAGNVVTLTSPVVIKVQAPSGSTAHRFVYALVRGDQPIYIADRAADLNLAQIRLQQRSGTQPGLLPGRVVLWVWGVDDHGDYGAPVSAMFDVAASAGS